MQIFFLDTNPVIAARMLYQLDKRRAQKQVIEGIQLLNNCCITLGILKFPRPKTITKRYYIKRNFPKVFEQWLLKSKGNLHWFELFLLELDRLLGYTKAVTPSKGEDYYNNLLCATEEYIGLYLTENSLTPFPNYAKSTAKGLDFTNIKPTTLAYKMYLEKQLNLCIYQKSI